jgi:hypothetical protein
MSASLIRPATTGSLGRVRRHRIAAHRQRRALAPAQLGFAVKELTGGIEHWRHEGDPVDTGGHVANV